MNIPLWIIALLPALAGIIGATRFKSSGHWDFFTPMLAVASLAGGLIASACLFIGYWMASQ